MHRKNCPLGILIIYPFSAGEEAQHLRLTSFLSGFHGAICNLFTQGAQRFGQGSPSFDIPALGQIAHREGTPHQPPLCNGPSLPSGKSCWVLCPHCARHGQAGADFPLTCKISADTGKQTQSHEAMTFSHPEMEFRVEAPYKHPHQPKALLISCSSFAPAKQIPFTAAPHT